MGNDWYDDYTVKRREQYGASADAEVCRFIKWQVLPVFIAVAAVWALMWWFG